MKASPLSNLNMDRHDVSMVGSSNSDAYQDINAHGELHPAPGPTHRGELELRIAGLSSDTPHSEYSGGATA
jgi:hypothetical protein